MQSSNSFASRGADDTADNDPRDVFVRTLLRWGVYERDRGTDGEVQAGEELFVDAFRERGVVRRVQEIGRVIIPIERQGDGTGAVVLHLLWGGAGGGRRKVPGCVGMLD